MNSLENNISKNNKIPGSPGCDSFTRPEEISALSKFLSKVRKDQEENLELERHLEDVPGKTTGKFPVIESLNDTMVNLSREKEIIELRKKLVSLDKIPESQLENTNLPKHIESIRSSNEISELAKKLVSISGEHKDVDLDNTRLDITTNDVTNLENTRLGIDVNNDVDLENTRLDINVDNDIDLNNTRLDIDVNSDIDLDLENTRLDININNDIDLENTRLNIDVDSDIDLENTRLDIDVDNDIDLEDTRLDIDVDDDTGLGNSLYKLSVNTEINDLLRKKVEISDLTDTILSLDDTRVDLNEDLIDLKLEESVINLGIEPDKLDLEDAAVKLEVGSNDLELEKTVVELNKNNVDEKDILLNTEKVNLAGDILTKYLDNTRLDIDVDNNIDLDNTILDITTDDITNLDNTRLDITTNPVSDLEDTRLDIATDEVTNLGDTRLDIDVNNDIDLEDTRLDITTNPVSELENIKLDIDVNEVTELDNTRLDITTNPVSDLEDTRLDINVNEVTELENTRLDITTNSVSELEDTRLDITTDEVTNLENTRLDITTDEVTNLEDTRLNIVTNDVTELEDTRLDINVNNDIDLENTRLDITTNPVTELEDTRLDIDVNDVTNLEDTRLNIVTNDVTNLENTRLDITTNPVTELEDTRLDIITEPVTELEDTRLDITTNPVTNLEDTRLDITIDPVTELEDTRLDIVTDEVTELEDTILELNNPASPENQINEYRFFDNTGDSGENLDSFNSNKDNILLSESSFTKESGIQLDNTNWVNNRVKDGSNVDLTEEDLLSSILDELYLGTAKLSGTDESANTNFINIKPGTIGTVTRDNIKLGTFSRLSGVDEEINTDYLDNSGPVNDAKDEFIKFKNEIKLSTSKISGVDENNNSNWVNNRVKDGNNVDLTDISSLQELLELESTYFKKDGIDTGGSTLSDFVLKANQLLAKKKYYKLADSDDFSTNVPRKPGEESYDWFDNTLKNNSSDPRNETEETFENTKNEIKLGTLSRLSGAGEDNNTNWVNNRVKDGNNVDLTDISSNKDNILLGSVNESDVTRKPGEESYDWLDNRVKDGSNVDLTEEDLLSSILDELYLGTARLSGTDESENTNFIDIKPGTLGSITRDSIKLGTLSKLSGVDEEINTDYLDNSGSISDAEDEFIKFKNEIKLGTLSRLSGADEDNNTNWVNNRVKDGNNVDLTDISSNKDNILLGSVNESDVTRKPGEENYDWFDNTTTSDGNTPRAESETSFNSTKDNILLGSVTESDVPRKPGEENYNWFDNTTTRDSNTPRAESETSFNSTKDKILAPIPNLILGSDGSSLYDFDRNSSNESGYDVIPRQDNDYYWFDNRSFDHNNNQIEVKTIYGDKIPLDAILELPYEELGIGENRPLRGTDTFGQRSYQYGTYLSLIKEINESSDASSAIRRLYNEILDFDAVRDSSNNIISGEKHGNLSIPQAELNKRVDVSDTTKVRVLEEDGDITESTLPGNSEWVKYIQALTSTYLNPDAQTTEELLEEFQTRINLFLKSKSELFLKFPILSLSETEKENDSTRTYLTTDLIPRLDEDYDWFDIRYPDNSEEVKDDFLDDRRKSKVILLTPPDKSGIDSNGNAIYKDNNGIGISIDEVPRIEDHYDWFDNREIVKRDNETEEEAMERIAEESEAIKREFDDYRSSDNNNSMPPHDYDKRRCQKGPVIREIPDDFNNDDETQFLPYYQLPDQKFSLDKNYSPSSYLRWVAELSMKIPRGKGVSRDIVTNMRKTLLEEVLMGLILARDLAEKAVRANKSRLPGNDFGIWSNLVSGELSVKNVLQETLSAFTAIETDNPMNRPDRKTDTVGWSKASSRPSDSLYQGDGRKSKGTWEKITDILSGNNSPEITYKFKDAYLGGLGISSTLMDLAGDAGMKVNTVEGLFNTLRNSPYFTTSDKVTTTERGYKVITLDSNAHWEIILEPYVGELNGWYTFLPLIEEINKKNETLHNIKTGYNHWIPINSFELQKEKLSTKSLGLYDGEIVYPVSMEYTNELRMTIVDDQYKSWRSYFEKCAQVAVFSSTPNLAETRKTTKVVTVEEVTTLDYLPTGFGKALGFSADGKLINTKTTKDVVTMSGETISWDRMRTTEQKKVSLGKKKIYDDGAMDYSEESAIIEETVKTPKLKPIVIDKNYHLVSPYKNLAFRCKILVMTPQLSTINKYELLLVLKDFSEERSGEIDSSGTDLNLTFSIVGENPDKIKDISIFGDIKSNVPEKLTLRDEVKKSTAANIADSVGNMIIGLL